MTWNEWLARFQLAEILRLPPLVAGQEWGPIEEDRSAAWDLYTELRTRIVSQPLHYLSGDEKTALESIAGLFKEARGLVRKHGRKTRHFTTVTVFTLNRVVRPFTAKWHKASTDGRLGLEDVRHAFREELVALQQKLRLFTTALGALAEAEEFVPGSESWSDEGADACPLGCAIPFAVLFDASVPEGQQRAIRWQEHNEIRRRRGLQPLAVAGNRAPALPDGADRLSDVAGLAISGGGLRSATFALGVLQGLDEKRMLGRFDYLSTVSGGGYIGSFLSSYLNSQPQQTGGTVQSPFPKPPVGESAALRHLRAHSKFLLSGGLMGRLIMVLQGVYGVLANVVIVVSWLLAAICVIDALENEGVFGKTVAQFANEKVSLTEFLYGQPWLGIVWLPVGALLLLMPLVLRLAKRQKHTVVATAYQRSVALISAAALVATLFTCIPLLFVWEEQLRQRDYSAWIASNWTWLGLLAILQRLGTGLAWVKTDNRWIKLLANVLLTVSGPLFFLLLFLELGQYFLMNDPQMPLWAGLDVPMLPVLAVGLLVYSHLIFDINQSSLHPFYRDRLSEAYLIQAASGSARGEERVEHQCRQRLSGLRRHNPAAPYHLINAALNAPAGQHPALRGRKSDIFVFSPGYCGCPTTGYFATDRLERLDPQLDLATAMAISGAAASPFMGTKNTPASVLFTLLNIRLDYWLPLPGRLRLPVLDWTPGPWYLLRQVLGWVNERSAYVNLSDGGHIENLGLYELLRRHCKFIVAIDGECDPEITCGSLVNLQRFVRTDFGIELELDLSRLKRAADGTVPFHFLLARIDYTPDIPDSRPDDKLVGYLLYLKSSVTGNEAPPIARYRADQPEFSHESTADLFYDEAQFEAYRSLGHHIAMELFRHELIGGADPADIRDWISRLLARLHEPAAL